MRGAVESGGNFLWVCQLKQHLSHYIQIVFSSVNIKTLISASGCRLVQLITKKKLVPSRYTDSYLPHGSLFPLHWLLTHMNTHSYMHIFCLYLQLQRSRSDIRLEVQGLKPAAPTFAPPLSTHMPADRECGSGPTHAMPEIHTGNLSCQCAHESPG